jgi:signal peptidase II
VPSDGADGPAERDPAAAPAPPRRNLAGATLAVGIVVGVVVLDQLTKIWVVAELSDAPASIIGTTVELRLSRNPGGAFSLFQRFTPILALFAIVVAVVLARAILRTDDKLMVVALALVLGGALGNLTDRIARSPGFLRGHVVDFVSVGRFPSFNVADSAITIGAVLLVLCALRKPDPARP